MKYLFLLTVSIISFIILGCSETIKSEIEEKEKIEVSFGFKGEVDSITQTPISTRNAINEENKKNWYAIQVCDETGYYAYGFFDNVDDMKLLCEKNSSYSFMVDMIPEGEDKVYKFSCIQQGWSSIGNSFMYSKTEHIRYLGEGYLYMNYPTWDTYKHPSCDRFYGILSNYKPQEKGVVNINLSRAAFKVKYVAKDFNSGSLELSLDNGPTFILNSEDGTEFEEFYSFNNLESESEEIGITIVWITETGKRIPLVAQNISFARNTVTTLEFTVKLNESTNTFAFSANEEVEAGETISLDSIDNLLDTEIQPES